MSNSEEWTCIVLLGLLLARLHACAAPLSCSGVRSKARHAMQSEASSLFASPSRCLSPAFARINPIMSNNPGPPSFDPAKTTHEGIYSPSTSSDCLTDKLRCLTHLFTFLAGHFWALGNACIRSVEQQRQAIDLDGVSDVQYTAYRQFVANLRILSRSIPNSLEYLVAAQGALQHLRDVRS